MPIDEVGLVQALRRTVEGHERYGRPVTRRQAARNDAALRAATSRGGGKSVNLTIADGETKQVLFLWDKSTWDGPDVLA